MEKIRCFGGEKEDDLYAQYHDHEWGIPEYNDQKLFEMLILEGAQAGLSWKTILERRVFYREAFYHFVPNKVASMTDLQLDQLLENSKIIRNRLKIYAARENARIFIEIQKEFGSFSQYLWGFVDGNPILNKWKSLKEIPAKTPESESLSKDLKRRGMSFVGPVIMYAYMQAVGLVNDHLVSCWKFHNKKIME